MKTKILIILLLLIVFSKSEIKAEHNDSVWTSYHWKGYKVSILGGDLHYYIKSKVKIEADNKANDFTVKFDFGAVEKISQNWYNFLPDRIGSGTLKVNDACFMIQVFPIPEPKVYLDGDVCKWSGVISKDALFKTTKIVVKNKYTNFQIVSYTISVLDKGDLIEKNLKDSVFPNVITQLFQKTEPGQKFYIENIIVKNPDGTERYIPAQTYKVIDSYNNEFIRKTVTFKPYTYDLSLLKNDLRIKIAGHPSKEDIKIITNFAEELNSILETVKVKIVDHQPSLTIVFDSIKNDSLLISRGFVKIEDGYKSVRKNIFFPFRTTCEMYIHPDDDPSYRARALKKDIAGLFGEFKDNEVKGSVFNYGDSLSIYDKYMLKTLYTVGSEYKVQKILDTNFDPPDRNDVYFVLIILSVILLFIFSEIYNYYGFNFKIGKIKSRLKRRIIEAILIAQIPSVAVLILLTEEFLKSDFHEIQLVAVIEIFFVPFTILTGILFLGLDSLLNRIKRKWLVTFLNFILSFLCIWLAYQVLYLFVTPEIVSLANVDWKIMLIPFLITLYRIYARFQTNKISGLLQEKELELTKQKELKFKSDLNALQARINPHFLYNALNSLASLAYIDAVKTEKMALSLSKLFRYNINKEDEHFSSVKDEIEMTEIYLEIEKSRFEDKLDYTIEVQNSLSDFMIPKFILQPLAENAVKHGVSKITEKGIIKIKIVEDADKVYLEIYDNGPEFPGGLISGYGLQNTHEKLKLLYKKPSGIEFINKPEKKLVIMLTK